MSALPPTSSERIDSLRKEIAAHLLELLYSWGDRPAPPEVHKAVALVQVQLRQWQQIQQTHGSLPQSPPPSSPEPPGPTAPPRSPEPPVSTPAASAPRAALGPVSESVRELWELGLRQAIADGDTGAATKLAIGLLTADGAPGCRPETVNKMLEKGGWKKPKSLVANYLTKTANQKYWQRETDLQKAAGTHHLYRLSPAGEAAIATYLRPRLLKARRHRAA